MLITDALLDRVDTQLGSKIDLRMREKYIIVGMWDLTSHACEYHSV